MLDGSARAVELAEDAQTILAKLETDVERYAHLRLASTVLAQAIERYREKHQGPILKRTNELFAHLTLNSFEGVRADFDDHDNPVFGCASDAEYMDVCICVHSFVSFFKHDDFRGDWIFVCLKKRQDQILWPYYNVATNAKNGTTNFIRFPFLRDQIRIKVQCI